ncbi:MAG: 3D domain-containing protein [Hyphomicrobiales bacterium]
MYYLFEAQASSDSSAVPLRNFEDKVIGPSLTPRKWCLAAIEGSVRVSGKVYNYAGTKDPRQADCSHDPSERVRWTKTNRPYGVGSKSNPLIPFKSLACDLGTVANSKPWVDGGYAKFGQRIYIPAAKDVILPDGTKHDGIFTCDDIGGKITGNHIDVFIGSATGLRAALNSNPFDFIKSSPGETFDSYLLP